MVNRNKNIFLLYIFACKMIFLILFFYLRRFLYIWIAYGISLNINRFTEYRDCYFNHIWHLNLHSNVPHCALFRHTGLKAQIWPYKIFYMTGLGENENFETKNFRILIIWTRWPWRITLLVPNFKILKSQLYFSNFRSLDYLEGMITWRLNAAKAYIKYTYWLWRYWWQKLFVWRIWSLIVSRRQQILDLKSRNINMLESIFKIYVN